MLLNHSTNKKILKTDIYQLKDNLYIHIYTEIEISIYYKSHKILVNLN